MEVSTAPHGGPTRRGAGTRRADPGPTGACLCGATHASQVADVGACERVNLGACWRGGRVGSGEVLVQFTLRGFTFFGVVAWCRKAEARGLRSSVRQIRA